MTSKVRVYGKAQNRTALGIIHAYQIMYPHCTLEDLKKAFPDALNPDSGTKIICMSEKDVKKHIADGDEWYAQGQGYFLEDDEWLIMPDKSRVAVVRMWTKPSFDRLVEHAKQYGIEIAEFEKGQRGEKGGYRLEYLNGYVPPKHNGFSIVAEDNGGYSVYQNGILCDNAKSAMREIAALIGMEFDASWTTRQFGAKLLKAIGESEVVSASNTPSAPVEDNTAAIEAAKIAAEKAKAELEKQKAEAEAAKAAAEKAQAEAEKAATAPTPAAPAKTSSNKGVLNGLFSVADNKKVRFSMGNLQFHAKKYEWRFAEHQYDRIGSDNTKISPNYDGWIDLFGYGTSGYMGCEPTEINCGDDYPNQDIANTNYDWGVYNPISNGGNKEGLWRTLTEDEWNYLLKTRPNAEKLRARACVNGINGLLLIPDDFFEHRIRIPFDSTPKNFSGNTYDLTQWATLQDAGVVFLPCNGMRKEMSMFTRADFYGSYWSSKYYRIGCENKAAYSAYYHEFSIDTSYYECYMGRGVRLVQDVK